jgi:nitrogen regulatory protein P-II 1
VIVLKKIEAIVRPERFEQIEHALDENGFIAMTLTEVQGRGEQKGIKLQYRGGTWR